MTVTVSRTMSARAQSEERKANIFLIKSITMLAHNTKQFSFICVEARRCLRTVTLASAEPGSNDSGSGLCMIQAAVDHHGGQS